MKAAKAIEKMKIRLLTDLEKKTGWGRNELKALIDKAYQETLIDLVEEKT